MSNSLQNIARNRKEPYSQQNFTNGPPHVGGVVSFANFVKIFKQGFKNLVTKLRTKHIKFNNFMCLVKDFVIKILYYFSCKKSTFNAKMNEAPIA